MTVRKKRSDAIYAAKHVNQLKDGLRMDGMSIEEVCQKWGIVPRTYYKWIERYPEFAEAHEYGVRDNMIWWQKLGRAGIAGEFKLNAAAYNFSMANLHGWQNKIITEKAAEDEIRTINITVLPGREDARIEHKPEVIDVEPQED